MNTPEQFKRDFIVSAIRDMNKHDAGLPERHRRLQSRIMHDANDLLKDAMRNSVANGVDFPDCPTTVPVEFSGTVTYFTNHGGIMIDGSGGIPVSVNAAKMRESQIVSVQFNGQICVMTVEEAFDRGLKEYADFELKTDDKTAVNHAVGNIVNVARDHIKNAD